MPKSAAVLSLSSLAVLLVGCGGEDTSGGPVGDATAPAEAADAPDQTTAADVECDLPDGLLEQIGLERQLVLNLAMAEGDNLETVESAGPPDPESFRSLAEVLDGLDLSAASADAQFDEPDDVVADLNETADLLGAALAAGADTADPAWTALSAFYTQEFFVRHNASVNYYLNEAGCV